MVTKPKILIVDDNPNNLYSFRMILSHLDVDIITVDSGEAALHQLLETPELSLILMDVQMPGMDGYETIELIRGLPQFMDIPILFVTAVYQSDDHAERGFRAGGTDYILKPVSATILKNKVNVFLKLHQQQQMITAANKALTQQINQRKKIEAALRHQTEELLRIHHELKEFLHIATHDLQEPVRIVHTYMQFIQQEYEDSLDLRGQEMMNYAALASSQMKQLIDGLRTYIQYGAGQISPVLVSSQQLVDEVLDDLDPHIQQAGAQITYSNLPLIYADPEQVKFLFRELLKNSLRFHGEQMPIVRITAVKLSTSWQFSFQDNGIGIHADHYERIFQIFQRLHTYNQHQGTGIGLSICRKIVAKHQGDIWVESELGLGTTIHFTLPTADSAADDDSS